MEKNFTTETRGHIMAFSGFYDSIWNPDDDINYECEEDDLQEDVDFSFDYKEYQDDVCKAYTEVWQEYLQQFIHEDIEAVYLEVNSPRYYNYETDKCIAFVRLTDDAKKAIMAKIAEHRDELTDIIKEQHTSYDGFHSYLKNDLAEWTEYRLFDDGEYHQPAYLFCMLQYLLNIEMKKAGYRFRYYDQYVYDEVMDDICVTTYFKDIEQEQAA